MLSTEEIKFFRHYSGFRFDEQKDAADEFNALAVHYGWKVGTVVWVRHHNKFSSIQNSASSRKLPPPTLKQILSKPTDQAIAKTSPSVRTLEEEEEGVPLSVVKATEDKSNTVFRYGVASPAPTQTLTLPKNPPYFPKGPQVSWSTMPPRSRRAKAEFYATALDYIAYYMLEHPVTIPQAVCIDLGVDWGDVSHVRGFKQAGTNKFDLLDYNDVRGLSNNVCRKLLRCMSINIKDYINTWFPIYRPDMVPYMPDPNEVKVGAVIGPVFRSRAAFMNHMKKVGRKGMFDSKWAKPLTPPGLALLHVLLHHVQPDP